MAAAAVVAAAAAAAATVGAVAAQDQGAAAQKSEATKAAEKAAKRAKTAAFLAARYPETSRLARAAGLASGQGTAGSSADAATCASDDEPEILGARTADERNAEGFATAVDLDAGA